ncbi:MAG: glutamate 5-kinase [Anaerolineales bacterium]|nr:glutamate 5-kinase [Anaerolineales bacterium]
MRIVIKLGTSTLTAGTPHISPPRLIDLARQVKTLTEEGHEVLLVTSGAMAAGSEKLGFPQLPKEIPAKQMLSAIGQPRLMALYEELFGHYSLTVAQVLLTRTDLGSRRHYLNARNTLAAILNQNVIPIINENDTITTEEIRVGDNDNLSALVANLVDADWLIMLTDQPGLFTSDPRTSPNPELVREIDSEKIPEALWAAAGWNGTGLGTGGMVTKLQAADLARRGGTTCIIASGSEPDVLSRLVSGEKLGTHFLPIVSALESRKRYILSARKAPGILCIDDGASKALCQGGSLLPVGLTAVSGKFERGDTVQVKDSANNEIARGIVNYAGTDLEKLIRRRSDEIETILGYHFGDEIIHHNNLVIL